MICELKCGCPVNLCGGPKEIPKIMKHEQLSKGLHIAFDFEDLFVSLLVVFLETQTKDNNVLFKTSPDEHTTRDPRRVLIKMFY